MATSKTILFVHGTGTRESVYEGTCRQIANQLPEISRKLDCEVRLQKCYWGHLGSKLFGGGASIPEYEQSGGSTPTEAEMDIALWEHLYEDPLYELRTLCLRGPAQSVSLGPHPAGALLKKLQNISSPVLSSLISQAELDDLFPEAVRVIARDPVSREAMLTASEALGEYRVALARAVVARAAELAAQSNQTPVLDFDLALRDSLVASVTDLLGGADKFIGGRAGKVLWGLASRFIVQRAMEKNRGGISDVIQPFIGDILVYQANGAPAQSFIRDRITAAEGDVIVLAHSLGGVASFDLIRADPPPNVKLLVTVGSQVPMLYEMNALHSLPYGEKLTRFVPWLNIYDRSDFLSYQAGKLFNGSVTDVPVRNGRRFPESHMGYWTNPDTWKAIVAGLKT